MPPTISLTLFRQKESNLSTQGILIGENFPTFQTLELPWKENKTKISCIPEGTYETRWHLSPRFGWCYKLFDVPGRSEILIHHGNYPKNTEGCILLGMTSSQDAVWNSIKARSQFEQLLSGDSFRIRIIKFLS